MRSRSSKHRNELLSEIRVAEERRANKLQGETQLSEWVKHFRQKYIIDGFLRPLYAWDGAYSRPHKRIIGFGDFILPYEMVGKVFDEDASRGWVCQESLWFWEYLISGQEIIFSRELSKLPLHMRLHDIPADNVWREIVQVITNLGYCGEEGGGILLPPRDIDEAQQINIKENIGWSEGKDGYLESYQRPGHPLWLDNFQDYEQIEMDMEIRPAWFHIANYAFFNAPIRRLAIFCSIYNTEGKVDRIRFLDDDLSNQARALIGDMVFSLPIEMWQKLNGKAISRERQDMIWWLWYNVGHKENKKTLSYGKIANIGDTSRSSIQTAIGLFNKKLRNKLDGKLLERLLMTANSVGLGNNLTYNTLADLGLVTKREREIDGFDILDN